MTQEITPFGSYAEKYRDQGFYARPIKGKKPFLADWQMPDAHFPDGTFEEWIKNYPTSNIGLVSGSPFPDGTLLGFFDIDHDQYVRVGKILFRKPKCIRIGKKGLVIPVRYLPELVVDKKIKVKGKDNSEEVAEFLINGALCAIPPSIHPDTGRAYRWEGPSLLEIDFNDLPLIGE